METTNLFNKSSLKMPLRIGIGALLTLFLMLPLSMIESLILERQSNYEQVSFEIGRDWGGQQTISGPFLIVPVKKGALNQIVEYYNENGKEKRRIQDSKIVISPKDLKINADIKPQSKHKGIYNFVVYNSDITVEGNFSEIDLSDIRINNQTPEFQDLDWENARIQFNISDIKGISGSTTILWNGEAKNLKPVNNSENHGEDGFYCAVGCDSLITNKFKLNMKLRGSKQMSFVPTGKTVETNVSSLWDSPKFIGHYSPDTSHFDGQKYHANWNLSHLSRSIPQTWLFNNQPNLMSLEYGVEMIETVDKYQQTYRSTRYSILFILLSFLTIFFFEFFLKKPLNILNYILIGLALILFYSLLLSLTEQMSFALAYLISSGAIITMISLYFQSAIKKLKSTMLISSFWIGLYSFLYFILQLEEYALLAGNIFLFIILGAIMFISSKLRQKPNKETVNNQHIIDKGDNL